MNNDLGRAGGAFVIPKTDLGGARVGTLGKSLATANDLPQLRQCDLQQPGQNSQGS